MTVEKDEEEERAEMAHNSTEMTERLCKLWKRGLPSAPFVMREMSRGKI